MKTGLILITAGCLLLWGCTEKPEVKPTDTHYLNVYPNPTKSEATIHIISPEAYTLKVFDTEGKTILEESRNIGGYQSNLSLDRKPNGKYQVILKTEKSVLTQTLIKI